MKPTGWLIEVFLFRKTSEGAQFEVSRWSGAWTASLPPNHPPRDTDFEFEGGESRSRGLGGVEGPHASRRLAPGAPRLLRLRPRLAVAGLLDCWTGCARSWGSENIGRIARGGGSKNGGRGDEQQGSPLIMWYLASTQVRMLPGTGRTSQPLERRLKELD